MRNAVGQITFSVIPQNPNDTFTYTLYHDANNNGVIDATDPMINDLSIITGGLAPQASIQLLLKSRHQQRQPMVCLVWRILW